jgi:hypothetical protein
MEDKEGEQQEPLWGTRKDEELTLNGLSVLSSMWQQRRRNNVLVNIIFEATTA